MCPSEILVLKSLPNVEAFRGRVFRSSLSQEYRTPTTCSYMREPFFSLTMGGYNEKLSVNDPAEHPHKNLTLLAN
jgi:hypothetical protein